MIAPAIPPWTPRSITCAEAGLGAVAWPIANAPANIATVAVARTALRFMLGLLSLGKLAASASPTPVRRLVRAILPQATSHPKDRLTGVHGKGMARPCFRAASPGITAGRAPIARYHRFTLG